MVHQSLLFRRTGGLKSYTYQVRCGYRASQIPRSESVGLISKGIAQYSALVNGDRCISTQSIPSCECELRTGQKMETWLKPLILDGAGSTPITQNQEFSGFCPGLRRVK